MVNSKVESRELLRTIYAIYRAYDSMKVHRSLFGDEFFVVIEELFKGIPFDELSIFSFIDGDNLTDSNYAKRILDKTELPTWII